MLPSYGDEREVLEAIAKCDAAGTVGDGPNGMGVRMIEWTLARRGLIHGGPNGWRLTPEGRAALGLVALTPATAAAVDAHRAVRLALHCYMAEGDATRRAKLNEGFHAAMGQFTRLHFALSGADRAAVQAEYDRVDAACLANAPPEHPAAVAETYGEGEAAGAGS